MAQVNSGRPVEARIPEAHSLLLDRFRTEHPDHGLRLGSGGESVVYALDSDRVLRVLRGVPTGDELERAYQRWRAPGFALPEILTTGADHGVHWQLMRRIPGRRVSSWLKEAHGSERADLLRHYVDAAFDIAAIETSAGYGPLLDPATFATWGECLRARLAQSDPGLRDRLAKDVPDLPLLIAQFDALAPRLYDGEPRLVHVDYCPVNVMADETTAGLVISGVLDFSVHSLFGDPLLDVVGAIVMSDQFTDVSAVEQHTLREHARRRAGPRFDAVFDSYRLFYALYYAMDEALLPWCVTTARAVRRTEL